jgi:DNA-binding transcriptional ArsR family regulator
MSRASSSARLDASTGRSSPRGNVSLNLPGVVAAQADCGSRPASPRPTMGMVVSTTPTPVGRAIPTPCGNRVISVILNRMVQSSTPRLDASFAALSDATRRGVLEQLGRSDASITDLAETFHMTLTGMRKHVGVLEQAELVTTEKVGRVRTCRLGPRRLEEETAWIERYRRLWDSRFYELDKVVEELKQKEKVDGRKKRNRAYPHEEPHDGGAEVRA